MGEGKSVRRRILHHGENLSPAGSEPTDHAAILDRLLHDTVRGFVEDGGSARDRKGETQDAGWADSGHGAPARGPVNPTIHAVDAAGSSVSRKTSEVAAFFWACATRLARGDWQRKVEGGPLALFQKPRLIADFSLWRREYSSAVLVGEPHGRAGDDLADALRDLCLSESPVDDARTQAEMTVAAEGVDPESDWSGRDAGGEEVFYQLVRPLAQHLHATLFAAGQEHDRETGAESSRRGPWHAVNSFQRSRLKTWQGWLEQADGRRGRTPLQFYPYLGMEVSRTGGELFVAAVSYADTVFIDENVPDSHRLPNVVFGIFDISGLGGLGENHLRTLRPVLHQTLGRLAGTTMAYSRYKALNTAAGEASEISRYWYSQGVLNLMQEDEAQGAFESEDPLAFWERFVEEILCARVPGVRNVETYPFDRAILINATGAGEQQGGGTLRMRVLESALRSSDANTLNQYLTSPESNALGLGLESFNVTDKVLKWRMDLEAVHDESTGRVYLQGTGLEPQPLAASHEDTGVAHGDAQAARIERKFSNLYRLLGREGVDPDQVRELQRPLWPEFDDEGLCYHYQHGLDLDQDLPAVDRLRDAVFRAQWARYDDALGQLEERTGADLRSKGPPAIESWAKVVHVAFEPRRHANNIAGEQQTLPDQERFTLLLIADEDTEKSSPELQAERKDLHLVIQAVLRQRYRDRWRQQTALHRQRDVVSQTVRAFVHMFKDANLSHKQRAALEQMDDSIRNLLEILGGATPAARRFATGGDGIMHYLLNHVTEPQAPETPERSITDRLLADRDAAMAELEQAMNRPAVHYQPVDLPVLTAQLPDRVAREAFRVVYKNAVEAAALADHPAPAVTVSVMARPASGEEERWYLDIIVVNDCDPLTEEVLARLNADQPTQMGHNKRKGGASMGIGVFTARTLLRSGLGRGADIRYTLHGRERLEARISLPVQRETVRPRAAGSEEAAPADAAIETGSWVLYLEDNPECGEPSSRLLTATLGGRGYTVRWVSCVEEARRLMDRALPALAILDMQVPYHAHDEHAANNGPYFLKHLLRTAAGEGHQPPVWVVTNHTGSAVREELADEARAEKYGYRVAVGEPGALFPEEAGVWILESVKDLNKAEGVRALLNDVPAAGKPAGEALAHDRVDAVPAVFGPEGDFDTVAQQFMERHKGTPQSCREILIGQRETESLEAVAAACAEWFHHAELPNLFYPEDTAPLHSATAHRVVVLNLRMPQPVLGDMDVRFRYWALRRNILPLSKNVEAGTIANLWATLPHDRKGPLSVLRHDIKNLSGTGGNDTSLEEAIALTERLDAALAWPDEGDPVLDRAAKTGADALAAALHNPSAAGPPVHEVGGMLNDLLKLVRTIAEDPRFQGDKAARKVAGMDQPVDILRRILTAEEPLT